MTVKTKPKVQRPASVVVRLRKDMDASQPVLEGIPLGGNGRFWNRVRITTPHPAWRDCEIRKEHTRAAKGEPVWSADIEATSAVKCAAVDK